MSPEINPCMCGQMIFDNDVNTTQQGKDVSSTNNAGKTRYPLAKECSRTLRPNAKLTKSGSKTA